MPYTSLQTKSETTTTNLNKIEQMFMIPKALMKMVLYIVTLKVLIAKSISEN